MSRIAFKKPGDHAECTGDSGIFDTISLQREMATDENHTPVIIPNAYVSLSIQNQRQRLPIFENRNQIIYLLNNFQTVVVVGESGCGKSTQIPQYLLEAGWTTDGKMIGITQPRAVSAVTLASRVAEERGTMLGQEVGYAIRFDSNWVGSGCTKIKYLTDGMMIREIMRHPLLSEYSVLMIDEAHERSVNTDIIIGLLRKIMLKRPELRIVIASATLDAELFADYFNLNKSQDKSKDTSSIISIKGRLYPVEINYCRRPVPNIVTATVKAVLQIHHTYPPVGDILAFLPGQDEVDGAVQSLRDSAKDMPKALDKLMILPMYGTLPPLEQLKVFDSTPDGSRKVVVATNIAETSVTIPGIAYVIDSGFVRLRALNGESGIESLVTVPISQASANQRAGRAGRIRPGKVFRLYTEDDYFNLAAETVPEMQRVDLSSVILQLKRMAIDNILRFSFLSPPSSFATVRSLELLYALEALNEYGSLTDKLGAAMSEMPLPPMHARTLLASGDAECSEEILSIIAMLQISDPFVYPIGKKAQAERTKCKFYVEEGDHLTLLNIYSSFVKNKSSPKWCQEHYLSYGRLRRAFVIRSQLSGYADRCHIPLVSSKGKSNASETLRRCLIAGFFPNAAKLHHTGIYHTIREHHPLKLHRSSVLTRAKKYPQWIIYNDIQQDSMRDVTAVELEWLLEIAPHFYQYGWNQDEPPAKTEKR